MDVDEVRPVLRFNGGPGVPHAKAAGGTIDHLREEHVAARHTEVFAADGDVKGRPARRPLDGYRNFRPDGQRTSTPLADKGGAAVVAEVDRASHAVAIHRRPVAGSHRLATEFQDRGELEVATRHTADKPSAGGVALDKTDDAVTFLPEQHVTAARSVLGLDVEVPVAGQIDGRCQRHAHAQDCNGGHQEKSRAHPRECYRRSYSGSTLSFLYSGPVASL